MHSRLRGLRCALTGALAFAGVATSLLCSAQTTVQQTSNVQANMVTPWTASLTTNQFNPTIGNLTSVTVTLNWTAYQSISSTNNDTSDEQVYADEQVSASILLPDGSTLTGAPPDLILGSESSAVISGTTYTSPSGDLPVAATMSAGPVSSSGTSITTTYTTAAAMAPYIGTSTVSFSASGVGSGNETDNGGNISWSTTTESGASVTVTYTYSPPTNTNTGCVQGTVINNKAGDGYCFHSTETGLGAGISITAYTTAGVVAGTAVTAADGTFEISGLLPNTTYIVVVNSSTLPKGYTLSCSSVSLSVNTPKTGCVTCVNFTAVTCNSGCQYNTFCQNDWSCTENNNSYNSCLPNCYKIVYPEGNCNIGGNSGSCNFNSCSGIENCLVHSGYNCPLPKGCQTNPKSYCNLGQLCGETLCCKLNCDFSDAGIFCSGFKNLTVQCGQFKGCTVAQVCTAANCYLNGQSSLPNVPKCSGNDLCNCLQSINSCFSNGTSTGFCK